MRWSAATSAANGQPECVCVCVFVDAAGNVPPQVSPMTMRSHMLYERIVYVRDCLAAACVCVCIYCGIDWRGISYKEIN